MIAQRADLNHRFVFIKSTNSSKRCSCKTSFSAILVIVSQNFSREVFNILPFQGKMVGGYFCSNFQEEMNLLKIRTKISDNISRRSDRSRFILRNAKIDGESASARHFRTTAFSLSPNIERTITPTTFIVRIVKRPELAEFSHIKVADNIYPSHPKSIIFDQAK